MQRRGFQEKLAYLIHIMGLSREVAKALLIDAAAGWNRKDDVSHSIGYGVVPKHINNIMKSSNDEIRFILTGASEEYETYTYNLPVPIVDNAHPFYARATLVYFPQCDRNQGLIIQVPKWIYILAELLSKTDKLE